MGGQIKKAPFWLIFAAKPFYSIDGGISPVRERRRSSVRKKK